MIFHLNWKSKPRPFLFSGILHAMLSLRNLIAHQRQEQGCCVLRICFLIIWQLSLSRTSNWYSYHVDAIDSEWQSTLRRLLPDVVSRSMFSLLNGDSSEVVVVFHCLLQLLFSNWHLSSNLIVIHEWRMQTSYIRSALSVVIFGYSIQNLWYI